MIPYYYAYLYAPDTVPKLFISGFPRNFVRYAVVVKSPGQHSSRFALHLESHFTDT